jgi:hypothetical protein
MSAPAVPLSGVACVEDAASPLESDAPAILTPSLDLDEVDGLLRRSVEARLGAVKAIAEMQYACDVADLVLERLRRSTRRSRR